MPDLTAKQHYWHEQLKVADSFQGFVAQYAKSQNIPAKKLYRWRNYFRKMTAAERKDKPAFAQVINASVPDTSL